ncbi:hypothetical protein [uncultured Intestinimonas sp.]|uniref:hypothetical protein n=1 Tax=uncultured Intestinimonas sp. TaxID=1689265 RepID=UPI00294203DA|nr:hypothetical protein [uncultured Intestinimonas sp.]
MELLTKEDYWTIRRAMDHRREITLTREVQGVEATVTTHGAPPVWDVPMVVQVRVRVPGMAWIQTFSSVTDLEEAMKSWKGAE